MADLNFETCPICLCSIDHLAVITTCNHHFCYGCITKWAKSKLHCPLCKTEFSTLQHTTEPARIPFISEILPPPVLSLVDTTQPDFECLTDTYFVSEINRLVKNAEKGKIELFRSGGQKQRNDFGYQRLNQVINRLNEIKLMLESEVKFSPYEVLTELYEVEAVLQLVWSGRIDELALSFPHSTQAPARRYGADDYNQFEEDDSGDSNGAERKQKKMLKLRKLSWVLEDAVHRENKSGSRRIMMSMIFIELVLDGECTCLLKW